MTDEELDSAYTEALTLFRASGGRAVEIHARTRHLPTQGIAPTAQRMFARLCFLWRSIAILCPKLEGEKEIWDFTSIALLARSLLESTLFFRYFVEPAGPEEWLARMLVMHLHDRCARVRLFKAMGKAEDVAGFEGEVQVHKAILRANPYFQSLDRQRQSDLLNGSRASIHTMREIGDKYAPDPLVWVIYDFLSSYTHSHPISYMRNSDERRDGFQNETDKLYIPGVLSMLTEALDGATKAFGAIPAGITQGMGESGLPE